MVKKLFFLTLGLVLAMGASAQMGSGNPTVPQDSIRFWTGTGSNRAVIAVTWDDDVAGAIGIAWGVQWNGTATVGNLMDTIATYDPRMAVSVSGTWLNNITYNDPALGLNLIGEDGWWWYNWLSNNDTPWPSSGVSYDIAHDGDFVDWMQTSTADVMMYATDPNAPTVTDATISASDILYWVGEGSNEVVFVVNWPDTALAWGYRFSSANTTLQDAMHEIAAADPRFSYVSGAYGIDDILFVTGGDTLHKASYSWWEHSINGSMSAGLSQTLQNGDFSRWADPTSGVVVDSTYDSQWNYWMYTYAYPQAITPVEAPAPQDATISADDILYWIGEGNNQIIFVVNWPGTALAWGYRFSENNTSLQTVMDDIAAADPRFSFVSGTYGIDDILFVENGDTLRKAAYSWWEHTVNGITSAGVYQQMNNGDFSRWADPTAGVVIDSVYDSQWNYWMYIYAYPQPITPVNDPNEPQVGPFCGAVGTDGCTAVKFDDSHIKGWATGCTLVLGSQDLSDPSAPVVNYGTAADAIGPASASTMDVVSLGDGGSATLTFERPIKNGQGFDFAVYENSFNDYFLELAFVEVSSDGVNFVRFPATSLTQTRTQITSSVDPTFINNLAGKYRVGYGTPFDLDELRDSANIDINNITHVRVIDVVGSIDPALGTRDAFGHMINDPFPTITHSAGFDLDGVAVLNDGTNGIEPVADNTLSIYPNPANDAVSIICRGEHRNASVEIFDMAGRRLSSTPMADNDSQVRISTAALPNGVYIVRVGNHKEKLVVRH